MYDFNIYILFLKNPVEFPNHPSAKEKHKSFLHATEGGCYVKKLVQKLPARMKRKLSKYI